MTGTRSVVAGLLVAVTGLGAAASVLHARETRLPLHTPEGRFMYLRSGQAADRLFLTFDALAADAYWIWTIQHYGRDVRSARTSGRFELLYPLLDLTTTLDPHFNVAYRFGAIFLAEPPPKGPGRTDQAIALLEKGLKSHPDRWQYAHDIGFVHYWHTGNFLEAARWFRQAADMPGAPPWIRPLAAATLVGGDRDGARRMLTEIANSNEPYLRGAAARALAQLQALDGIDQLTGLVREYWAVTGRPPASWNDLVRAGLLSGVPADSTGEPFDYDPGSQKVTLSPRSSLAPLPRSFGVQ